MAVPNNRRVYVTFDSKESKDEELRILRQKYAGGLRIPDSAAIRRAIRAITKNG